jgi:hypothetical protein
MGSMAAKIYGDGFVSFSYERRNLSVAMNRFSFLDDNNQK